MKTSKMILATLAFAALAFSGCGPGDNPNGANGDGKMTGNTQYKDAKTNDQGQPQPAAKPDPQPMEVTITMSGTGTFPNVSQACNLDGSFSGSDTQSSNVSSDGSYSEDFDFASKFVTSGGCAIPQLKVGLITSMKIVAKLQNTSQNCKEYCDAQLRASCEQSCDAQFTTQQGQATCRATCEANGSASCQQQCTGSTTNRITAEVDMSAAALSQINSDRAGLDGVGELNVDLTFDHITQ